MRRLCIVIGLVVVAASCAAFARGSAQPAGFRLADAGAACRLTGERLVCANLRVKAGLSLAARGTPHTVPARIWWDASTPVLKTWTHGALTCRSAATAIVCRNASGAAISLDAAHIAVAL